MQSTIKPRTKDKKQKRETIYSITIAGLYFASSGGQSSQKPFTVECKYDQDMVVAGVIGVFKRLLAKDMLKPKHPDYSGLAEADVIEVTTDDGSEITDLQLMNRVMLEQHILEGYEYELPIDTNLYDDCHALRQAIQDCVINPTKFEEQQAILKKRKGGKLSLKSIAMRLNSQASANAPEPTIDPVKEPLPKAPEKGGKAGKDVLGNL